MRSGRLIKLALGGILSMMGEWMTQQMMGGMAGRLGQTPLAAHVTMQVRTSRYGFPCWLLWLLAVGLRLRRCCSDAHSRMTAVLMSLSGAQLQTAVLSPDPCASRAAELYVLHLPGALLREHGGHDPRGEPPRRWQRRAGLTVTKLTLGCTNGIMLSTAVLVLIFRDKIPLQ